ASTRGPFAGDVRLTDRRKPRSFVLRASGAGAPGTVTADVAVALTEFGDGGTLLSYDADVVVGGMVGGVGQRVLSGVAAKTAGEFFAAVNDVLTGTAEPLTSTAAPLGSVTQPEAGTAPPATGTAQPPTGAAQPPPAAAQAPTEPVTAAPPVTAATAEPSQPLPATPAGVSASPTPGAPTGFARLPTAQPASRAGELWALVAAARLGAFATLAGVAVGWALARSTPRPR